MIRLDKMLSHLGYGSRKEVKEYIRKGYVLVNGEIVNNDDFKVDEINDEVVIADEAVSYERLIYIMLNKPAGYVSATYDLHDPTVLDLIDGFEKRRLFPVGRLDKDTVGLLLLTNDGKLAHRLLSPKQHIDKVYYLKYEGTFQEEQRRLFSSGVILDDGYQCLPAEFISLGNQQAKLIIREGKFHQVKRMMEAVGCKVTYLKRIQFGNLSLDSVLAEGEYRILTEEEIRLLKQ